MVKQETTINELLSEIVFLSFRFNSKSKLNLLLIITDYQLFLVDLKYD